MEKAEKKGIKIHLPTDFVTANKFDKDASVSQPESLVISVACSGGGSGGSSTPLSLASAPPYTLRSLLFAGTNFSGFHDLLI